MADFDQTTINPYELSPMEACLVAPTNQCLNSLEALKNSSFDILKVDEIPLISCPPQAIAPEDLHNVLTNPQLENTITKYYVSELIGIKAGDLPNTSIFPADLDKMPQEQQVTAVDFLSKISNLIEGNDLCDKQGIRYIGQYLKYYCPNSSNYNSLKPEQVAFIDYLHNSTAPIMALAKKWADCK
jgi:hypothetical protein